jgi:hypothetical protein
MVNAAKVGFLLVSFMRTTRDFMLTDSGRIQDFAERNKLQ